MIGSRSGHFTSRPGWRFLGSRWGWIPQSGSGRPNWPPCSPCPAPATSAWGRTRCRCPELTSGSSWKSPELWRTTDGACRVTFETTLGVYFRDRKQLLNLNSLQIDCRCLRTPRCPQAWFQWTKAYLCKWLKSNFIVSRFGLGSSWISFFTAWTLSLDSLISAGENKPPQFICGSFFVTSNVLSINVKLLLLRFKGPVLVPDWAFIHLSSLFSLYLSIFP